MKYPKHAKRKLFTSFMCILLCISMLLGSTFAWFTDRVSTKNNIITSGNLDLEMYWTDDPSTGVWNNVEEEAYNTIFSYDNWEPGYTDVKYIKIVNKGELALNYDLSIEAQGAVGKLAEVINVYTAKYESQLTDRAQVEDMNCIGLLSNVMNGGSQASGTLLPEGTVSVFNPSGEVIVALAMQMITTAGNEYQNESSGEFTIRALATQAPWESDSFGSDYDSLAEMPIALVPTNITVPVTPTAEGTVGAEGLQIAGPSAAAYLPEGVKLVDGATEATLRITPKDSSDSGLSVVNDEIMIPVDVHIDGVAQDNTVPIIIDLGVVLPKHLNMGNYKLVHVEDGNNVEMTSVANRDALVAHNQFTYDSNTGAVSICMASFSEVTLSADTANPWNGDVDYKWFTIWKLDPDGKRRVYTIANGDQLNGFARLVGDMYKNDPAWTSATTGLTEEQKKDLVVDAYGRNMIDWGFNGHTFQLINDINLADGENGNDESKIFYPIGYWNSTGSFEKVSDGNVEADLKAFRGTFNGNGHTISNFYQNTWEMFGSYNDGYGGTPNHYDSGMGLFGYLYGATLINLSVNGFSCDGEFTPAGVIAAYAAAAADSEAKGDSKQTEELGYDQGATTIQGVSITNCNPRVYNTGNGGIIGIGGNNNDVYKKPENDPTDKTNDSTGKEEYKTTNCRIVFDGVTVDNSNKISALWGSWDVACGGLMGMFRGRSRVVMTNCSVSAQIDVFNDVCGNYQYYWYRYAGMLIGSLRRRNIEYNGYIEPDLENIAAFGTTVHFDKWNDYYYCELVANSLASYTHDHQFSRLEQIQSVSEIQKNGVWTKTGNYLLIKDDGSMECYHIVKNSDGSLKRHMHDDEGTQIVDGREIPVEDHRIVYLPFDQLFQGDGWGVKHVALTNVDYNRYPELKGITILDKNANLLDHIKFEAKYVTSLEKPLTIAQGSALTAGDLFDLIKGEKTTDRRVAITIDKINAEGEGIESMSGCLSKLDLTLEANKNKTWKQYNIITFTEPGLMKLTIQDHEYCKPTYLYVQVVEATAPADCEHCADPQWKPFVPSGTLTAGHYYLVGDVTACQAIKITGDVVIHLNGHNMTFPESAAFTVSGTGNQLTIVGSGNVTGAGNETTGVIHATKEATVQLLGGTYDYVATTGEDVVVAPAVIYGSDNNTKIVIDEDVTVRNIVYATEDSAIELRGKITKLEKGIDLGGAARLLVSGMTAGSKVTISANGAFTSQLSGNANTYLAYFQAADGYDITIENTALVARPKTKSNEEKLAIAQKINEHNNQYWITNNQCPMCGKTNVTWKEYTGEDVYHTQSGHWVIRAKGTEAAPIRNNNIVYAAEGNITMCVMLDMAANQTYYSTGRFLLRPGNTLNVMGTGNVTSNGEHKDGTWGDLGLFTMVGRNTTLNLYGGNYTYTGGYQYKSAETGANVVDYPKYALINASVSSTEINIFDSVTIGDAEQRDGADAANYNVYTYGTLNMFGGTIRNGISATHVVGGDNEAKNEAGGNITLARGAVLNMYGGTITGGKTGHRGGNILMRNYSTLNMSGGVITGGQALDENLEDGVAAGGNIGTHESAHYITLNITGGEISNGKVNWNESDPAKEKWSHMYAGGGNIYLNGGKTEKDSATSTVNATISGGTISGGNAASGGNIYIRNGAKMTISGSANISGGTATIQGGNINVFNFADLTIAGGTITGGTAPSGGNINVGEDSGERAALTISGGTITGGKATNYGGNVCVRGASILNITGGNITGGTAAYGGNIYAAGAEIKDVADPVTPLSLTISGGTISGGKATNYGGNLYVFAEAIMNITGGNFIGDLAEGQHNAKYGGNIAVSKNSTMSIGGTTTVSGGRASLQGGNLYVANGSTVTVKGTAKIEDGQAYRTYTENGTVKTDGKGGNICGVTGATLNIQSGTITDGYSRLGGNIAVGSETDNKCTLTISGGTISGGTATINGGNLLVSNLTDALISGGTISGGKLTSTNYGENIYVGLGALNREPSITISGGTITGPVEIAQYNLGTTEAPAWWSGTVILSGKPQIQVDDTAQHKWGLCLRPSGLIDISGLQNGAKIDIYKDNTTAFTNPSANASNVLSCFTSCHNVYTNVVLADTGADAVLKLSS